MIFNVSTIRKVGLLLKYLLLIVFQRYNSAKKDNDFIYHESVPGLDTLGAVKGIIYNKGLICFKMIIMYLDILLLFTLLASALQVHHW